MDINTSIIQAKLDGVEASEGKDVRDKVAEILLCAEEGTHLNFLTLVRIAKQSLYEAQYEAAEEAARRPFDTFGEAHS